MISLWYLSLLCERKRAFWQYLVRVSCSGGLTRSIYNSKQKFSMSTKTGHFFLHDYFSPVFGTYLNIWTFVFYDPHLIWFSLWISYLLYHNGTENHTRCFKLIFLLIFCIDILKKLFCCFLLYTPTLILLYVLPI